MRQARARRRSAGRDSRGPCRPGPPSSRRTVGRAAAGFGRCPRPGRYVAAGEQLRVGTEHRVDGRHAQARARSPFSPGRSGVLSEPMSKITPGAARRELRAGSGSKSAGRGDDDEIMTDQAVAPIGCAGEAWHGQRDPPPRRRNPGMENGTSSRRSCRRRRSRRPAGRRRSPVAATCPAPAWLAWCGQRAHHLLGGSCGGPRRSAANTRARSTTSRCLLEVAARPRGQALRLTRSSAASSCRRAARVSSSLTISPASRRRQVIKGHGHRAEAEPVQRGARGVRAPGFRRPRPERAPLASIVRGDGPAHSVACRACLPRPLCR